MKDGKDNKWFIRLIDDENESELFQYESDIVMYGSTQVNFGDCCSSIHAKIMSMSLTPSLIKQNLLDNTEALYILETLSKKIMNMRLPDINFIVMNNFEQLKMNFFFQSQQLLQGKSICDICINEMQTVKSSLKSF